MGTAVGASVLELRNFGDIRDLSCLFKLSWRGVKV